MGQMKLFIDKDLERVSHQIFGYLPSRSTVIHMIHLYFFRSTTIHKMKELNKGNKQLNIHKTFKRKKKNPQKILKCHHGCCMIDNMFDQTCHQLVITRDVFQSLHHPSSSCGHWCGSMCI